MNEVEHSVRLSPTWLGQMVQLVLRVIIQICRKLESQKVRKRKPIIYECEDHLY